MVQNETSLKSKLELEFTFSSPAQALYLYFYTQVLKNIVTHIVQACPTTASAYNAHLGDPRPAHTSLLPAEAVVHGEGMFKRSLPVPAVIQSNNSFV